MSKISSICINPVLYIYDLFIAQVYQHNNIQAMTTQRSRQSLDRNIFLLGIQD